MRKNKEEYKTELLIFRIFLKCVKKHHLYHKFRCSVKVGNRDKDLFHTIASQVLPNYNTYMGRLSQINSSYLFTTSLESFLKQMHAYLADFNVNNGDDGQMILMNVVNGLIHSCVEYSIYEDFSILEKLGEEVFTEVGKALFGDGFTDKTAEQIDPEQAKMMEKFGRMMPPPNNGDYPRGYYIRPTREEMKNFNKWVEEYLHTIHGQGTYTMPPNIIEPNYDPLFDWVDDDGYDD